MNGSPKFQKHLTDMDSVPYKDPEDQKRYMRQHYEANKELYLARAVECNRRRRVKSRDFVRAAKAKPCTDCGAVYPYYVMQFDHLDPSTKLFNIGTYVGQNYSIPEIAAEIEKCELVCANCHAERTHQRRSGDRI